jgi:hypothetical protein
MVCPTRSDNEEVKSWKAAEVLEWARNIFKLPEKHIQKLQDNEITGMFLSFYLKPPFLIVRGDVLFSQTKEDFYRYGIPGGPTAKLVQAIEALKTPTGTFPFFF